MDPRLSVISERLKNIKRVIAVSGAKGGIGKSSVASVLSLTLSELGYKVGLLDLDFCSPSTHVILGINHIFPREEKGIVPPKIYGIDFMSIIYYTSDEPSPLRGIDVSNALIELLAITRWGSLDFLIIDLPPGVGDTTLDVIRLMKKIEFLIVTTNSKLSLEIVKKLLKLLKELKIPILGAVENMKVIESSLVEKEIKKIDINFLGEINFDKGFEGSLGNTTKLLESRFAQDLREIVKSEVEIND